ncbi:MAG: HlyD family efflux transporter periplasmic adaptor subunit [Phycisphaerae bacterium]|nr:HlyD family efflux transporter periplasmic adaptor subunit [Phycisphaerae bacterium]
MAVIRDRAQLKGDPQTRIGPGPGVPGTPGDRGDNWVGLLAGRLLVAQCSIGQAKAGAILAIGDGTRLDVVAVCPAPTAGSDLTPWLARSEQAAGQILADPSKRTGPWQTLLPAEPGRGSTLLLSLDLPQVGRFVEAFAVQAASPQEVQALQNRLVQAARLVETYDQQVSARGPAQRLQMIKPALEVLSAIQKQPRFLGMAMALCNQIGAQWSCERVSLGVLKGRMIHLKATSHAEHVSRKSRVIQDLEAAMEECLDQDVEVAVPADPQATTVSRAAGELCSRHGSKAVLAIPLRSGAGPKAVVLLERPAPFDEQSVGAIRLTGDVCAPALLHLHEQDRWFGARWASRLRRGVAVLIGAQHTWTKLLVLAMAGLILFVTFGKGTYKVQAPFVVEATVRQSLCAPFDGYIKDVAVEVGDRVQAGQTVLAELDTAELKLQLAAAKAEHAGYIKQRDGFRRDREEGKAQIAEADANKVEAQIELLAYTLERARLVSPVEGTIVSGELKRQIGAPVKTGQVLFEVTPLESLRAELMAPEDQVLDLAVGQKGALATASYPDQRIPFVVERINPVAEVVNGQNVFKVRARLEESREWMRPGMEGVAKVSVDRRPYLRIWTRKLVNWVRMKLWL